MNTERLLSALEDVANEYRELGFPKSLQKLQAALEQYVNQPADATAQEFRTQLNAIRIALEAAPSNDFAPSRLDLLRSIGATNRMGIGLSKRLDDLFSRHSVLPATALIELTGLIKEISEFNTKTNSLVANLEALHFVPDRLKPMECEIAIVLPRAIMDSDIEGLSKELRQLNIHLKALKELTGDDASNFKFKSIGTTDPLVVLGCLAPFALNFAEIIEWTVEILEKVLKIKKATTELIQSIGEANSQDEKRQLEGKIEVVVEMEIERKTADLFERFKGSAKITQPVTPGRENELPKAVKQALKYLFDRVRLGTTFEVSQGLLEESDDESDTDSTATTDAELHAELQPGPQRALADKIEKIRLLNTKGRALTRLSNSAQPLLQLSLFPDEISDADGSDERQKH